MSDEQRTDRPNEWLRQVPSVNEVLQQAEVKAVQEEHGRLLVGQWVREVLNVLRKELVQQAEENDETGSELPPSRTELLERAVELVLQAAAREERRRLVSVVNATGVVLHTGLGRAPLSSSARQALSELAGACNVEIDLESSRRTYRGFQLRSAWQLLTGAEDVLIVNNNAAATLLTLKVLCCGREVVISRGQLIEIGGSFRLPEIFELSGAVLKEVGTTNRTHLSDYEQAVNEQTAAILHVHASNYQIVGFSDAPEIDQLVPLGRRHGVLVIDDIGSGALVNLQTLGLPPEPSFSASLKAGADLVLGSGDKLLGGPQCGIILGRAELVARLRKHPLARAVRVGKLTLAALAATLETYLRERPVEEIPVLRMLTTPVETLQKRAEQLVEEAGDCQPLQLHVETDTAPVGGGSLPTAQLPTAVVVVTASRFSAHELARRLRCGKIPVFPRVRDDRVVLDLRSVQPEDDSRLALALRLLARNVATQ